MLERQKLSWEP